MAVARKDGAAFSNIYNENLEKYRTHSKMILGTGAGEEMEIIGQYSYDYASVTLLILLVLFLYFSESIPCGFGLSSPTCLEV